MQRTTQQYKRNEQKDMIVNWLIEFEISVSVWVAA